jgi:hypothetical protein
MNEVEVVQIIRDYIETQFPKKCSNCNRIFGTLREYVKETTHAGKPVSFDADIGEWKPERPLGTHSYANCPCGNTLIISSDNMSLRTMWRLLFWAKCESWRRGISTQELLEHIRKQIDDQVLGE